MNQNPIHNSDALIAIASDKTFMTDVGRQLFGLSDASSTVEDLRAQQAHTDGMTPQEVANEINSST